MYLYVMVSMRWHLRYLKRQLEGAGSELQFIKDVGQPLLMDEGCINSLSTSNDSPQPSAHDGKGLA